MAQALLSEGFWPCIVLSGAAGADENNTITVRITVKFDDGPSKGRIGTYEDKIDARSSLYVQRSCRAVGWKGVSLSTFAADVAAWIDATGGKSTVEIKHIEIKKGKRRDEWVAAGSKGTPPIWDKVNSIGRGPKPLVAATGDALKDADEAMRAAMRVDGDDPIPF